MEVDIGDEEHVSEYQLLAIKRENEAKARRRERRLEYIKKMQDLVQIRNLHSRLT